MNEFVNIAALIVAFFVGLSIGYVVGYEKSERWYNFLINQYQNLVEEHRNRNHRMFNAFLEASDFLDNQTQNELFSRFDKLFNNKRENEK